MGNTPHRWEAGHAAASDSVAGLPALAVLLEALGTALAHRRSPWEFAVEMERLLAAGATVELLRGWADDGVVEHGVETTRPRSQRRRFARARNLRLPPGTCFILTAAGAALAHRVGTFAAVPGRTEQSAGPDRMPVQVPSWDGKRLRWGDVAVREFRQPADNQKLILATFQELGWVAEIDDPLPGSPEVDAKIRLHDTIKDLNRYMRPRLLHFAGDGTGGGVRWEYLGEAPPTAPRSSPRHP